MILYWKKKLILFVYFLLLFNSLISQNATVDSLLLLAEKKQNKLQKLELYELVIDKLVDSSSQRAIDLFIKHKKSFEANTSLHASVLPKVAYGYGLLKDYPQGHALLDQCFRITRDSSTFYYAKYIRGKLFQKEKKYRKAIKPLNLARQYYENRDSTQFRKTQNSLMYGYLLLHRQYENLNNDSARLFLLAGDALYQQQPVRDTNTIVLLFTLGATYAREYDTLKGFQYLDKSADLAVDYYHLIDQSVQFEKGLVYGKLGLFDKAIVFHEKSLKLAQKDANNYGIFSNTLAIGQRYNDMEMYRKAIPYLEECYDFAKQIKNKSFESTALNNLADSQIGLQHTDKALDLYQQALTINDSLQNNYGIIIGNLSMAQIKNKQDQIIVAQQYNQKAYRQAKALGFKEQLANSAYLAAELTYKQGDTKGAILKLQETIQLKSFISKSQLADTHKNLSKYYESIGNYQQALNNHKSYKTLKDSIFDIDKTKAFAELETRFQNEKIIQENEFLQLETKQNETILQQRNWLLLAIGSALLFLAFLARNLVLRNKQKQVINQLLKKELNKKDSTLQQTNEDLKKANKEVLSMEEILASKDLELTTKTASLHSYSKKMERIDANITQIISDTDADIAGKLYHLKRKLRSIPTNDGYLIEFNQLLTSNDPLFFQQLILKHPNLTTNDLNHCAFIRLNMSLKEVAELMHITEGSVKKARYRLKRKIHLPTHVDLKKYLISLR